jgi:phage baseplate assembly protein W
VTAENGRHLSFPFRVGPDGRTAGVASLEEHVRDELIQLLLTNPGERAFLPEFGGGLRRLVFEPADEASRGMTKAAVTQAISNWLGHRITLEDLAVEVENATIEVEIKYRLAGTEDSRVMRFQRGGEPG